MLYCKPHYMPIGNRLILLPDSLRGKAYSLPLLHQIPAFSRLFLAVLQRLYQILPQTQNQIFLQIPSRIFHQAPLLLYQDSIILYPPFSPYRFQITVRYLLCGLVQNVRPPACIFLCSHLPLSAYFHLQHTFQIQSQLWELKTGLLQDIFSNRSVIPAESVL